MRRKAQLPAEDPAGLVGGATVAHERGQRAVALHRTAVDAGVAEQSLDVVEVDAQSEQLGAAAAATDDLEQAVIVLDREVTGAQLVDGAAQREVRRRGGVAEHDVRSGVDQLSVVDPQVAAGHGNADRLGPGVREVRREVRHPSRRLGRAVHHEEVEAVDPSALGPLLDPRRRERPTGLGDPAQPVEAGQLPADEVGLLEELERVRDTGERGRTDLDEPVPERVVDHRLVGQPDASSDQQV